MTETIPSVYEQLAARLDAIPNGFPRTQSGIELRILQKLFRPEEAQLASVMRLRPEDATEIAERAGAEPDEALEQLQEMAGRGLIRARRKEDKLRFGDFCRKRCASAPRCTGSSPSRRQCR